MPVGYETQQDGEAEDSLMGLRDILDAATPGPWEHRIWGRGEDEWPERRVSVGTRTGHGAAVCISPRYGALGQTVNDARLIALAPELAALCLDMGDFLRDAGFTRYGDEKGDDLLARLARIGEK